MGATNTERVESVQEYYGRIIQSTKDLKTSACCAAEAMPPHVRSILAQVEPEILDKFYGCGSPIPPALDGCVVLDLGCGTGRDVYVVSKLVGERGRVIGVDMTPAQLQIARRHVDYHTEAFGFARPNVEFRQGFIEDLAAIGIEDDSIDVVISNCVINLSPDKQAVFAGILRVLKPGGELYFSDVFAGCRVPQHLQSDPVLVGECLAGAMYSEDFRRMLQGLGCPNYRVVMKRDIALDDPEVRRKAGMIPFCSMTVRAFKLPGLEDICEDYGQVAVYKGTIPEYPHEFLLDNHHLFKTGKPMLVCGNTASMVQETRYGRHFEVTGDRSRHHGPFPCGPAPAADAQDGGCACA